MRKVLVAAVVTICSVGVALVGDTSFAGAKTNPPGACNAAGRSPRAATQIAVRRRRRRVATEVAARRRRKRRVATEVAARRRRKRRVATEVAARRRTKRVAIRA
jgi:hypothetical protein